jgi:succinate dehydrogenase hydrophobic anchor subunit
MKRIAGILLLTLIGWGVYEAAHAAPEQLNCVLAFCHDPHTPLWPS